jgi:hypothetical protein
VSASAGPCQVATTGVAPKQVRMAHPP